MNRYDKFFSELTLITFTGGAMGSFLINFLSAGNEEFYREYKNRSPGLRSNHEWQVIHYFQDITYVDNSVLDTIRDYYGKNTYIQQSLYALAHIVQDLYLSKELTAERTIATFNLDKILELVKKDFDQIIFPYVKNHGIKNSSNFGCNNPSIKYKKKIYCTFSKNKTWIIPVFSLYKHNLYKLFTDNREYDYGNGDLRNWLTSYHENKKIVSYPESIYDHESLEMYELVFNKNLDGLRKIYPDFEPNSLQLELLDQAHNTSLMVLNDLNISHDLELNEFRTKDFLDQTGLISLLHRCLKLEKNT